MTPKLTGSKHRSILDCSSLGSCASQLFHRVRSSSAMTSFQLSFFLHGSSRIFTVKIKGLTKPRRSYTDESTERIPLLVGGFGLTTISKPKVSEVTLHRTPRALSTRLRSKSKLFTGDACLDSGTDSTTCGEFNSHFVR